MRRPKGSSSDRDQNPGLSSPPITEAVIQVSVRGSATDHQFHRVVKEIKKSYPNHKPLQKLDFEVDAEAGQVGLAMNPREIADRLSSEDEADVVIVSPKSVITARLAPYLGWTNLRDRARSVWEIWRRFIPYHPITRLGIRYINRIDIPVEEHPLIRVEDFLCFYPHIPPVGGGPIFGYIMQSSFPLSEAHWVATITSTIVNPSPVPNRGSLLLDIDVSRTQEISPKEDDVWQLIDEARFIKNAVFEACVTEKARELFRGE